MRNALACRSAVQRGEKFLQKRNANIAGISAASVLLLHGLLEEDASSSVARIRPALKASCCCNGLSPSALNTLENEKYVEEIILKQIQTARSYVLSHTILAWGMEGKWGVYDDKVKETDETMSQRVQDWKPKARFPSLQAQLLQNSGDGRFKLLNFQLNSNEPIPVENDLFVGHVMLVLRPLESQDDPDYAERVEEPDATMLQFQIQGRFKRKLRKDQLLVGAETRDPLQLGSLTKRCSELFLRLLSTAMGSNMTYSFGRGAEVPHISFPLHTGMDCVITSKLGEEIPHIGKPFLESEESKIQRQRVDTSSTSSSGDDEEFWNTNDTYSISYTAKSIDLPAWKVLLPFEIQLGRFWGESALHLVIYENDKLQNQKNYLFDLQLAHLGMPNATSGAINHEVLLP
jgi:Protein of unknown function (DUF1769)